MTHSGDHGVAKNGPIATIQKRTGRTHQIQQDNNKKTAPKRDREPQQVTQQRKENGGKHEPADGAMATSGLNIAAHLLLLGMRRFFLCSSRLNEPIAIHIAA